MYVKNIVLIFLKNYIKISFPEKKKNSTIFFPMRFTLIDHAVLQILLAAGLVPCYDTYTSSFDTCTQCPNTYATCARATMPSTFRLP